MKNEEHAAYNKEHTAYNQDPTVIRAATFACVKAASKADPFMWEFKQVRPRPQSECVFSILGIERVY